MTELEWVLTVVVVAYITIVALTLRGLRARKAEWKKLEVRSDTQLASTALIAYAEGAAFVLRFLRDEGVSMPVDKMMMAEILTDAVMQYLQEQGLLKHLETKENPK